MFAEDREYVERVLAGETQVFENLVRKYNRLGGAIAYGIVKDFQLAEDIVQEAFLKAYRSLGSLRSPERFRLWFSGIVKKQAIDVLRQRKAYALSRQGPNAAANAGLERAAVHGSDGGTTSGSPMDQLLREEQRQKILEAIAELPQDDRLVLVMKHMEGLSYKEIAETTGTSVSAVESRLFRARQALRKKLAYLLKSDSWESFS
jgi:RNA polymerase sigma-70 factor (ECF subfamily)